MREIEFRGKLSHSKQWVYGNLIIANNGDPYIIPFEVFEPDGHHLIIDSDNPFWVEPESVGQFTGLLDKKSKKIFEGDVLKIESWSSLWLVIFDDKKGHFTCKGLKIDLKMDYIPYYHSEIIGNVTENPELLK